MVGSREAKRRRLLRRSPGQLLGLDLDRLPVHAGLRPLPAQPRPAAGRTAGPTTASDLQGVLLYAATTISFFTQFFTGERTTVTDAVGATWRTGAIYETSVLLTVYGMFFIALLALLRIAQRRTTATASAAAANTIERGEPNPARSSA
jgi:hypothetical protein